MFKAEFNRYALLWELYNLKFKKDYAEGEEVFCVTGTAVKYDKEDVAFRFYLTRGFDRGNLPMYANALKLQLENV
jgi:hypothetical protein